MVFAVFVIAVPVTGKNLLKLPLRSPFSFQFPINYISDTQSKFSRFHTLSF